jgi:hypothetical protein
LIWQNLLYLLCILPALTKESTTIPTNPADFSTIHKKITTKTTTKNEGSASTILATTFDNEWGKEHSSISAVSSTEISSNENGTTETGVSKISQFTSEKPLYHK